MANARLTEEMACDWPAGFGDWAERAPRGRVLCGSERQVPWRLRPPDAARVAEVVREAARHGTALWPVSRGKNWGYGSHLPAREGCVIVDLCRLDFIGDLDLSTHSLRIGPGATQAAVHAFLRANAPEFALNVTGSGADTSVLGNALERGIGYSGEKDRDLFALEVVLADGTLVGPSRSASHNARVHPAGLSTDQLFFQSGLGIVVGARIRLRLRQEAEEAILVQGDFGAVVRTLKRAYDAQLITGPTHVGEPGRTRRLGSGLLRLLWRREPTAAEVDACFPEGRSCGALAPLCGRRAVVNAVAGEIARLADPGVKLTRVSDSRLMFAAKWLGRLGARLKASRLLAMRPVVAFVWGEPSDAGLASLDGYSGGDPDGAERGAIYGNAVLAVDEAQAKAVRDVVRKAWRECAFTWIVLDPRCMLAIYTLHFDRPSAADARAANSAVVDALRALGHPPYRLGINQAAGGGALAAAVKAALDPQGIIAPGRYDS